MIDNTCTIAVSLYRIVCGMIIYIPRPDLVEDSTQSVLNVCIKFDK